MPKSDLTDRDKRLLVIGAHARALLECLGQLPEDTDLPGHIWAALGKLREGAEAIRCDPVTDREPQERAMTKEQAEAKIKAAAWAAAAEIGWREAVRMLEQAPLTPEANMPHNTETATATPRIVKRWTEHYGDVETTLISEVRPEAFMLRVRDAGPRGGERGIVVSRERAGEIIRAIARDLAMRDVG